MTSSVVLTLTAATVTPGEELVASVALAGEDARGLRVELLYVNEYTFHEASTDGGQTSSSSSVVDLATGAALAASSGPEATAEIEVVVQSVALTTADGPVAGEHELRLPLPEDAPPTAGTLVRWKVRAVASRDVGDADVAEADVVVASNPQTGAATLQERAYHDPQLTVIVPGGQAVRAGDTITGTLVLTPEKAMKFTDLRVAIQSTREDREGIKLISTIESVEVAGKTAVEAGARHEAPFSITVPANALPTFASDNNRLDYGLVASGARRLRFDINTTLAVYVASPDPAQ